MLQLSTTATYDPVKAHLTRATAELRLQPFTGWTLALAPDFGDGFHLESVHGGMQLMLPGAWSVAYGMRAHGLDTAVVSHTVTTRYRSSFGHVRFELAQSAAEKRVGVFIDVPTF